MLLKRAAYFIRVVEDGGIFDALDLPEDTPKLTERIYAYRIVSSPGYCHMNFGRGRGWSGPVAEYSFIDPQPGDEQMRTNKAWSEWCQKQIEGIPE